MRLPLFLILLSSTAIVRAQFSVPAFVPPEDAASTRLGGVITRIGYLSCPVGMAAERQASAQREWVVSLVDAQRLQRPDRVRWNNAGVHVELSGSGGKAMARAEVTIYYTAPGTHTLLVNQGAAAPTPELSKTFVLSAADGSSSLRLAGSLLVGPASTISRVRLLHITYSDGSMWQAKSGSDCSVEPGLLMAVAAR